MENVKINMKILTKKDKKKEALEVSDQKPDIENLKTNSVSFKGTEFLILKLIPLCEIFNAQGLSFDVSDPKN